MPLSATVKMSINAQKDLEGDLGSGSFKAAISALQAYTDGAGAGQVDQIFSDTRTLAASATEDLDVAAGGGLTDVTGEAVEMARIKAIAITAAAANTNDVVFSRPAANGVPIFGAAGDSIAIPPGGCILWMAPDADGVAVTAGTGDLLTFTNSAAGTSVDYNVTILGAAT